MSNGQPHLAFVAYSSRDSVLAGVISNGVAKANRMDGTRIRYTPWNFNDIAGQPLISPILEGIEGSKFIVADITYLNPNVVYEIGFAIGRRRRCFLVRHGNIEGDKRIASEVGIFDTLGYDIYVDEHQLANSLTAFIDPRPMNFSIALDRKAPVYVVEPPSKGGH